MRLRLATALVISMLPAAASAQDDRGASIGGTVAALNMDSQTDASIAATFGYRFSRVVGFEIEATMVPDLEAESVPIAVLQIFPGPRIENAGGRAVIFSTNVRAHIPTTTSRLDPYFVAGGGMASVRYTADVAYSLPTPIVVGGTLAPGVTGIPVGRPITSPFRVSSTDMALTIGGGLGVRVASRLFVDADLRMFRLLGEEDRNAGRFGVGIRYRF